MKSRILVSLLIFIFLCSSCSANKASKPTVANPVNEDGKTILTLGVFGYDKSNKVSPHRVDGVAETTVIQYGDVYRCLTACAKQFSGRSDKYTIEIIDYGLCSDEEAILKFITQVSTGKIPDIMLLTGTPYEDYIRKGLFCDLNQFIDSEDSAIKREELFPGLLKAMESSSGGLYWISPENIALTWFGKKSVLGDVTALDGTQLLETWNKYNSSDYPIQLEEYENLQKAITYSFFGGPLKHNELLNIVLNSMRHKYIDYKTGTCDFETQEFIDVLELCKAMPDNVEEQSYDTFNNPDAFTVDINLEMIDSLGLTNFQEYQTVECFFDIDDLAFIGVPGSAEGEGLCIPYLPLAISANSGCKEGAWEFIQSLINREYTAILEKALPLSQKVYEDYWNTLYDGFFYKLNKGETEALISNVFYQGQAHETPPFTRKDYDLLIELINRATIPYYPNDPEYEIIKEEANNYFQGQYPVEKAAENIQSRMSIYMSEHY